MTDEQYQHFKKVVEDKGYKLVDVPRTISNENFYYYKGFSYTEDEGSGERTPGYQVIFLVWDFRKYEQVPDCDEWGITPMVLTESHEWSRIDLQITEQNFDVDKVEQFAHDFYFHFLLVHGL